MLFIMNILKKVFHNRNGFHKTRIGWLSSQCWAETRLTQAFEDAPDIPPFSREDTCLEHIWVISGTDLGYL